MNTDKTQVKLGPDGKGGYYTPYATTIIYSPTSQLDVAMATLAQSAQIVAFTDTASLADTIEHPTPTLIILAEDFERSLGTIGGFFRKGFQKIRLFKGWKSSVDNSKVIQEELSNVTEFGPDTLYENIAIIDGMGCYYAIEHLRAYFQPGHVPIFGASCQITADKGRHLYRGITESKKALSETLLVVASSCRSFDMIDELVRKGQNAEESEVNFCNKLIRHSWTEGDMVWVNAVLDLPFMQEFVRTSNHPRLVDKKYVVLFANIGRFEHDFWVVRRDPTAPPATEAVRSVEGITCVGNGTADVCGGNCRMRPEATLPVKK